MEGLADRSAKSLNPEQQPATHSQGPALVLAGPGTGKTTTLVGRYRFLLEQGVSPTNILATTFTRAAARQLKQRISQSTGLPPRDLMVGTFHALCLRLLDGEIGQALGLRERVRIVSEGDRFRILQEVVDRSIEPEECLEAIDRYKDRLIGPASAREELAHVPRALLEDSRKLVDAYEAYQVRLSRAGLHDFGDLLMLVVSALGADPDLRSAYSERYRHLLVDEFQDVNPAQHAFIQLLLDQHGNLLAVGDDDQAIYGWRGSDVKYILGFSDDHPGASTYRLARNYRSQSVIVERATQLISNNRSRFSKPLRAVSEETTARAVKICGASGEVAEAEWIARSIQELARHGVLLEEIAILVRARYLIPTLGSALASREIAYWASALFETVVRELADLVCRRMPFGDHPEKALEWEGMVETIVTESQPEIAAWSALPGTARRGRFCRAS